MQLVTTTKNGSKGFSNEYTKAQEEKFLAFANERWAHLGMKVELFGGRFNPIDGYIWKDERVYAVIEFKSRPEYRGDDFAISIRKYLWLMHNSLTTNSYGLFIVETADGYFVIDADDINTRRQVRSMYKENVRNRPNDMEPGILIPMQEFKKI